MSLGLWSLLGSNSHNLCKRNSEETHRAHHRQQAILLSKMKFCLGVWEGHSQKNHCVNFHFRQQNQGHLTMLKSADFSALLWKAKILFSLSPSFPSYIGYILGMLSRYHVLSYSFFEPSPQRKWLLCNFFVWMLLLTSRSKWFYLLFCLSLPCCW